MTGSALSRRKSGLRQSGQVLLALRHLLQSFSSGTESLVLADVSVSLMQVIDEGDLPNMLRGLDIVLPFLIHLLERQCLFPR